MPRPGSAATSEWSRSDPPHDAARYARSLTPLTPSRGPRKAAMNAHTEKPTVGIVMGSDSDWPVMKAASEALEEFGVAHEADVVSAHRMPEEMLAYGRSEEHTSELQSQ